MKKNQFKFAISALSLFAAPIYARTDVTDPAATESMIRLSENLICAILVLVVIILALLKIIPAVRRRIKRKNKGYKIVLLRHGESVWNKENRFTGWTDVELSELGVEEAKKAGVVLKKEGYAFDLVFTSVLKRAIDTTDLVLKEINHKSIEIKYAWQLNERHYGSLQGLNKAEMAQKYGEEQVRVWRRSYSVRPPAMDGASYAGQNEQKIFSAVSEDNLPRTESLADTYARAVGYWNSDIAPAVKEGKRLLISAHGNSLRAIVKYLDNISDDEISELNIPTGVPLVYELDENLNPIRHYYLGDQSEIEAKINKVKNQGKGGEAIAPKI